MHHDKSRATRLAELQQRNKVPVLIVGGGINGISTWRELTLQGIPAVLVEKDDWCQAASGALSRMIHGGLRYLESGEFGLVKESVQERNRLLKNAPHYVFPLRTTVPIENWHSGLINAVKRFFRLSERPSRRGALLIKTGLMLYDLYTAGSSSMPKHRLSGQRATRARWPGFADWVRCSASYYDAWISAPERLGIELIEEGEQNCPDALALNYMAAIGIHNGAIELEDRLSGQRFLLQPEVLVNASGAWIDQLNTTLQRPSHLMGGTKGSHLILHHPHLLTELGDEMVYFENQEGRVCIMFPWFGHVLVGSTDIRTDDPDQAVCTPEERAYILNSLRFVFPHFTVNDDDVIYSFCGVRPLPASSASVNGRISRNHAVVVQEADAQQPFPTLSLVGGKWTTFRRFGEQAADAVLLRLNKPRLHSTEDRAIGGGRQLPQGPAREQWLQQLVRHSALPLSRIEQLVQRYGSRILLMLPLLQQDDQPLRSQPDYSASELLFLTRHEHVMQLEDLLVRRTSLAMSGTLTQTTMEEISQLLATELGWSEAQRQQQVETCRTRLEQQHQCVFKHLNLQEIADVTPQQSAHEPVVSAWQMSGRGN
ncbi:glycerol-3-phosphate dehydrogenase/oxidase [Candidatus Pantoea multigeneris]|uniref:Glycerol-3-phosphate dehydrogenase/oxidase n=1 Tax=Candidatus Pantoea multigeneris TaxID=2608357 RepID=A0ABX0REP5_9GAMM|nr:glycerol-3-phosphate dehydrogenase/oxidase [Pantoea multigeneris]NIF23532.1 glycerol-3-phosphate dehydrogenase/oxidase [Pantoea multigeneris]